MQLALVSKFINIARNACPKFLMRPHMVINDLKATEDFDELKEKLESYKQRKVLDKIFRYDYDKNYYGSRLTMLDSAVKSKRYDIAKMLIEYGVLNQRIEEFENPFSLILKRTAKTRVGLKKGRGCEKRRDDLRDMARVLFDLGHDIPIADAIRLKEHPIAEAYWDSQADKAESTEAVNN